MSLESMGSYLDESPKLKKSPEELQKLDEDVKKVEKSIEYSKQLTKVNDVLNVLDLPDKQEEIFRKTLDKQDSETLKKLAKKSKNEIITFLSTERVQVKKQEAEKQRVENKFQNEKYQENDKKFKDIKNILPN